jgi:hypothetical protein
MSLTYFAYVPGFAATSRNTFCLIAAVTG